MSAIRHRRLECGLTQAELAVRADVSRQLVAAVEANRNVPAVDAALRLAAALTTSVEELFGGDTSEVVSALGGPLNDGAPLRIGRVGDQLVATALEDHGAAGAGWAKPDAVLAGGRLRVFDGARPAGAVIAGCDPALGVAEAMLTGLGTRSVLSISASTGSALRALERGRLHAAVVHGRPGELPDAPLPVMRFHLARWRVGLGVPRPLANTSLDTVLGAGGPIVQRDRAAASQHAFERACAATGIRPGGCGGPLASGHLEAARMAAILGCAAVTTEGPARAFGLSFLALEDHTVEIWVAEPWLSHPGIDALADLLTRAAFTERVAQFGGYDLTNSGVRVDPRSRPIISSGPSPARRS